MRWIPYVILVYLVLLVQTSLLRMISLNADWCGTICPDLAAVVAVFIALRAPAAVDAMLACWLLGMGLDLTTAGGVEAGSLVGPMAIAFALAGGMIFRVREAFFRERVTTQVLMTVVFCVAAHGLWLVLQRLRPSIEWGSPWTLLLQTLLIAAYSATITPLSHAVLGSCQKMLFITIRDRSR